MKISSLYISTSCSAHDHSNLFSSLISLLCTPLLYTTSLLISFPLLLLFHFPFPSLPFPCIRYCIRLGLIAFSKGRDNGSGSESTDITLIELIAPVSCTATCNAWADKVGKGANILRLRESV